MAAKGAQRVTKDSSDSDDSMSGRRPVFSSEETALPDDLLENSEEFLRLYEKHQPELQQLINDLEKSADEFLNKYETATRVSIVGGTVGAAGVVGTGAALLLAPFTGGLSLALGAASLSVAVGGGATSFKSNTIKEKEEKKAVAEVENALKKFNTTTDRVTNRLKNVCNDVEKIVQFQNDEQSHSVEHGVEHFRESSSVLSELTKLFIPGDLQRLLQQGIQTFKKLKITDANITSLLKMITFAFIFEDSKTLSDFVKLKRRPSVREEELESKAGKLICKMRETNEQLQNTLNELKTSKSEVERVLILNLNQYVKQQRETHKSAESD